MDATLGAIIASLISGICVAVPTIVATLSSNKAHGASTSTASSYDYCGIVVNYNTDTSIKAKVFGSEAINKFSIIGIKY